MTEHASEQIKFAAGVKGRTEQSAAWQQFGSGFDPAGRVLERSTIDGHINQEADCINWHMQRIHTTAAWLAVGRKANGAVCSSIKPSDIWASLRKMNTQPSMSYCWWPGGFMHTQRKRAHMDYNSMIMYGFWCCNRLTFNQVSGFKICCFGCLIVIGKNIY